MKWSITAGLFLLIVGLCLVTGSPSYADTPGITVTSISGLVTTEAGGIATFTIVLNNQPAADVSIGLTSNDSTEGTVSPSSVTFDSINWAIPQTVTVTGIDDAAVDGNIIYRIITAPASSTDITYNGLDVADVSVANNDNDVAGITVTPTSGLFTLESGGTANFTIVLNTRPLHNVDIGLSSNNDSEGTISLPGVTFTPVNWNIPQRVTIKGEDDAVVGDNIVYKIITAPASSTDTTYNGLDADDVVVTNNDNEIPGITVNSTLGLVTTKAGGTAAFTVRLNKQPKWAVFIGLSSNDSTEGTVSPSSVTFNSTSWSTPQTVTVKGEYDAVVGDNIIYKIITAPASSDDISYNGLDAADVIVTNTDNDTAGITVSRTSGLVTTEAGGTAAFTIVLNTRPTFDVLIGLGSNDSTEGTVLPFSVTFTKANWNISQTVTVTGVDDFAVDGNITYRIVTAAAISDDSCYNGLDAADVSVTNNDTATCQIGKPQTPSPGNNSIDSLTNILLSWNASANASSYDVYFSTSENPLYYANTSNSSYQLSQLNYGTKYCWKVVARNSCGLNNSSDIWSFTTVECVMPSKPQTVSISPASGATDIVANIMLNWFNCANASSYDVYLDTSENPSYYANTSNSSYQLAQLKYSTKYYWKVVAKNSCGNNSSDIWSFTTGSAPIPEATLGINPNPTYIPTEILPTVDNGGIPLWLWIALGLGCALTLVTGAAIFIIAKGRSQKKGRAAGTRLPRLFRRRASTPPKSK